jgi:DNA-binding winged helix-turn-helix (wHTH) protein/tetratricopeptide (TPR) repeat protein
VNPCKYRAAQDLHAGRAERIDRSRISGKRGKLGRIMQAQGKTTLARRVRFAEFELHLKTHELRKGDQVIKLREKVFQLLQLLLEHGGEGVTREEIRRALWTDATTVDFARNINTAVKELREVLGDSSERSTYIETLPHVGYKLLVPAEWISSTPVENSKPVTDGQVPAVSDLQNRAEETFPVLEGVKRSAVASGHQTLRNLAVFFTLVVLVAGVAVFYRVHRRRVLTEQDTIVMSEFINKTGEPVFDGTLRQAVSVELEQSPFLRLLSDERIGETLALMLQPKQARLTPDLAREVCQRTRSAATVGGSIAKVGKEYVLGLSAADCRDGEPLGDVQEVATDREHVLKALDRATINLRGKLGESLSSLHKYDVPLDRATTPSLEALQYYSLGMRAQDEDKFLDVVDLSKRAIDLDPSFAMAYMLQAIAYGGLGENERAVEKARMAYKLRDRLSQPEKLVIETYYLEAVTGNIVAAQKAYAVWAEIYPHDPIPVGQLGNGYLRMGDYDAAVRQYKKYLELDPSSGLEYVNLAQAYIFLNRPNDAEAAIRVAQARHLESLADAIILYEAAYLRHDATAMDREKSKFMGKPGYEDQVWEFESDSAAYGGQFRKARELSDKAADSARRAGEPEVGASYEAESAMREGLAGKVEAARQEAKAALAQSNGVEVEAMAAIAFALAGESAEAERLARDLNKRFPEDTTVQLNYLPVIRTAAVLHTSAAKALEATTPAERYELGFVSNGASFEAYPTYFRGEALLANRQGAAAAAAFQKLLDHPGIVMNEPIAALAYLGLARSYALSGNEDDAKASYQDFLALWKDADPDVPVYKRAKAEYAALQ